MSDSNVHVGTCFCGAVEVTVTGEPAVMGYCHCKDCRAWSAGPVNAFTIWPPEAVQITKGAENARSATRRPPQSIRKWCKDCGGHLLAEHPLWGVTDVAAAVLPDPSVQGGPARELREHGAADEGRAAEAEGLPGRDGRLRGAAAGVSRDGAAAPGQAPRRHCP